MSEYPQIRTEAQARNKAREFGQSEATPLDMLIGANEVIDGANSWRDISEEKIEQEAAESASMYVSETLEYSVWTDLPAELADIVVNMHRINMTRAPLGHLVFDTWQDAARHGYWTHDVSNKQMNEFIHGNPAVVHPDETEEIVDAFMAGFADETAAVGHLRDN